MTTAEIIDQVLTALTDCLTPEAAREIMRFRPDDATQQTVDALAEKADAGTLTDAERETYLEYIDAFDLVATIKSKARGILSATDD